VEWFRATEQALMDAVGVGDRRAWERVLDPACIVTSEEGEVLTRDQFLSQLGSLPPGLTGSITVKDVTVQEQKDFAVVRYLGDEREQVFGQSLSVQYRVTDTFRRDGKDWKLLASHTSIVTRDPPDQTVARSGWKELVGRYKLMPNGWVFIVERHGDDLYAGPDPSKLKRLIPLSPVAFVRSGSLGEWIFVVEDGKATRIVNLRKFGVLVWTRVEGAN
jgi:hypothetical protein